MDAAAALFEKGLGQRIKNQRRRREHVVSLIEVNQRSSMTTINRLPITKARINLGQIARRAHNGNEYFILEKDGIPVIGIMAADELEDYLEIRSRKVKASIAASDRDRAAGKTRPAVELLAELKRNAVRKTA
jgi:antitoxin (DNA-binding transcriptional repressor) of toxin-antitoxin stability system